MKGNFLFESDKGAPFLDVKRCAEDRAQKRIAHEMDIAIEIYLVRRLSTVHYVDLMNDVPPDTASKSMLLAWLNDSTRNGALLRPGLINLYQKERVAHYPEGVWSAKHFCEFIAYIAVALTNEAYVGNQKAALFKDSFLNPVWFDQARSVCGAKLLEDCYHRDVLKSSVARRIISTTLRWRDCLIRISTMIGRSTKNHQITTELYSEIKQSVSEAGKLAIAEAINTQQEDYEEEIFQEWRMDIAKSIEAIPREIGQRMLLLDDGLKDAAVKKRGGRGRRGLDLNLIS